mmetsp:Transcript_34490/g.111319  ORF Transcript_34490/g.111319 Transcript_34490/m.111319 type:complete len:412 (-) Transcript_34490:221-1456(-)|eukprot:scaffold20944_cov106-Isochrysis_galbana.AAC.4
MYKAANGCRWGVPATRAEIALCPHVNRQPVASLSCRSTTSSLSWLFSLSSLSSFPESAPPPSWANCSRSDRIIFSCRSICTCCCETRPVRLATRRCASPSAEPSAGRPPPSPLRYLSSSCRSTDTRWLSLSDLSSSSFSFSRLFRTSISRFLIRAACASARRRASPSSWVSCCSATSSRSNSCRRSCSMLASRSRVRSPCRLAGLPGPSTALPSTAATRRCASFSWSLRREICSARPRAPELPSSSLATPSAEPTSRSSARRYLASSDLTASCPTCCSDSRLFASASRCCTSLSSRLGEGGHAAKLPPPFPPHGALSSLVLSCCRSDASSAASCALCAFSRPSAIVLCFDLLASSLSLASRTSDAMPSLDEPLGAERSAAARSLAACMRTSCSSRSRSSSCSSSTCSLCCR